MSKKTSNIKTLSDFNNKTTDNMAFIPSSHIASKTSNSKHSTQDKTQIIDVGSGGTLGETLGGNKIKDVRKARVSYYENLIKNMSVHN
jgi:hypothetical protein